MSTTRKRILRGNDRPDFDTLYRTNVEEVRDRIYQEIKDGIRQGPIPSIGVVCPLQHTTFSREGLIECWRQGCFDKPVYDWIEVHEE